MFINKVIFYDDLFYKNNIKTHKNGSLNDNVYTSKSWTSLNVL